MENLKLIDQPKMKYFNCLEKSNYINLYFTIEVQNFSLTKLYKLLLNYFC